MMVIVVTVLHRDHYDHQVAKSTPGCLNKFTKDMELDTVCRQFEPYLTAGCQGLGAEITELEIVQHTMRCVWLT